MITSGFSFIALIICFIVLIFQIKEKSKSKIFEYVPPLIIIYLGVMIMSTVGVWKLSIDGTKTSAGITKDALIDVLLPSMIFLMLLKCNLKKIIKLGPRMISTFLMATFSISVGFVVTFIVFKNYFEPDSWKTFGVLAGSWIGETQNMIAVQKALSLSDSKMGYALLIDSIDYAIWIMILLFLLSSKIIVKKFNKFTKTNISILDELSQNLHDEKEEDNPTFLSLFSLLAFSLGFSAFFTWISNFIPSSDFFSSNTWMIIFITITGIIGGMTSLNKISGSIELSNIMLYTMIALIASSANFKDLTKAPIYILSGFLILFIHFVLMFIFAKLFKIDLFTCCITSCANIGGIASSSIVASSYNSALIPVGVLLGMLGTIIGTGTALIIAKILSTI